MLAILFVAILVFVELKYVRIASPKKELLGTVQSEAEVVNEAA